MGYNVQDMYLIKDDIQRAKYVHMYFWNEDSEIMEDRINEYLLMTQDGTFDDSYELKIQTMLAMLTNTHQNKYDFKSYNELYYNIVMDYMKGYNETEESAHLMLNNLKKDGYEEWVRRTKINKIINKLE
jgi:hypothetical protein